MVSDQKIYGYKMRYKTAVKITNDTSNKVKYCRIFGTPIPFSGKKKKTTYIWKEKNIYETSKKLKSK